MNWFSFSNIAVGAASMAWYVFLCLVWVDSAWARAEYAGRPLIPIGYFAWFGASFTLGAALLVAGIAQRDQNSWWQTLAWVYVVGSLLTQSTMVFFRVAVDESPSVWWHTVEHVVYCSWAVVAGAALWRAQPRGVAA